MTEVDGFLPGQALTVDTTHRGGIDDVFLVAAVRISIVNDGIWDYRITAQESEAYQGSHVEQWKKLVGGGSPGSGAPGELVGGGAIGAGDIYSSGSVPFAADQSMGGNRLTNVEDPSLDQDAATKGYVDSIIAGGGTAAHILVDSAKVIGDDEGWVVPGRLEIGSGGTLELEGRLEVGPQVPLICRLEMAIERQPATLQISNEGTIDWFCPGGSFLTGYQSALLHAKKTGGWIAAGFHFIGYPVSGFSQNSTMLVTATVGDNMADNTALTSTAGNQGVNHATTVGLGFRLRLPCRNFFQIRRNLLN